MGKKILNLLIAVFLSVTYTATACDYTVNLIDSYGDGWNGATLTVLVNGEVVLDAETLLTGSAGTLTFSAETGDEITTTYVAGSYAGEPSYEIVDAFGNVVASDGLGGTTPLGISEAIIGDCPEGIFMSVSTTEINFGDVEANNSVSSTFTITNTGTENIEITNIVIDNEIFSVGTTSGIIIPGENLEITVTALPEVEGEFTGTLTISSNTDDATISLTGNAVVYEAGEICSNPLSYGNINGEAVVDQALAAGEEFWYEVTLDQTYANVMFATCGSDFDTKLEVWASCEDDAYLYYVDDYVDDGGCSSLEYGGDNYASLINVPILDAGTYFVKVYGYSSTTNGIYQLRVLGDIPSSENDFLTFSLGDIQIGESVINTDDHTITAEVGASVNLTTLEVEYTLSDYATVSDDFTDFTNPVEYNVVAQNGSEQSWNVNVTNAVTSGENDFLSFILDGTEATINAENYTITVEVSYDSDLTNLNATYEVSNFSNVTTEVITDFSSGEFIYTVVAEDESSQDWTLTVTQEAHPCTLANAYGNINDPAVIDSTLEAGDFVWYSVVLDQNYVNVEFSTCNSNFDTDLEVWESCDATEYLAYADYGTPRCGESGDDNYWASSIILENMLAGTYFVKVFGYGTNFGNFQLSVNGEVPADCYYSVVLKDFGGDGWGTNSLTVNVNGEENSILTSTTGEETFNIPSETGNVITTVFTAGEDGDDYECVYEIYDVLGNMVYSYDVGTSEETGTNEITVNCEPEAEPVTNLTSDALNTDIQLNWNLNELGDEVYVAYSSENEFSENVEENEIIYSGTETSFTHEALAEGTHYYSVWSLNAAGVYSVAVLTEVTITPSCNYSVVLMDTYGDGWGTNTLSVFVDGLEILTNITSTTEEESFDISARTNDIITVAFTAGNDGDDYECLYKILDVLGNEVYSYDVGISQETGNPEVEVNCEPEASPVTDLSAEVISGTEISLTWDLNELGDEVYVAYSSENEFSEVIEDNNIIYNGIETNFTHIDLAEGTHYYSVWSLNAVGIYSVSSTVDATIYGLGEDCSNPIEFIFNGEAQTGSITSYGSAWYSVVLDDTYANVEFSLCNNEITDFDTKLEVWTSCDAEEFLDDNDDNSLVCGSGGHSIITLDDLASGTYYVKVYGYNSASGNYELSITGQEYIAPVTDLNATIISDNTEIQLDWLLNNNSNNVVVVYNNLDDFVTPENGTTYEVDLMLGNATVLYLGNETSFNHSNLDLGNYYYQVWSVNENNNYSIVSEVSEELFVAPVTDLTTEVLSDTEIKLDWILNDLGNNIVLAYNTTNVFGETPNDLDENTTILYDNVNEITFTHTGLDFGTYYYKIWSIDANGNYSNAELISESIYSEGQDCTTAFTYGNINDESVIGDIINAGDAVWYEVTLDKSYENVEISTCNSNFDTDLQIWRNCDDATYLTYTDFGTPKCGESGDDNYYASRMNLDYLFEGTYYIKVYGYQNSTGNYELSITGEEAITCDYTLNLDVLATATDGWDGNTLSVYVNDMLLGDFTVDGENSEFSIPVNTTNVISTIFADNNGDGYNCTYTISDVLGNVVYTEGEDEPIAGLESLIADCNPDVEPIANLDANVLESNTEIELTWDLNELGDNVIVAYNTGNNFVNPEEGMTYSVDGLLGEATIVYVGNESTFTMDNLEAGKHSFSVWAFNSIYGYSEALTVINLPIYGPGDLCTDPFAYGNINDESVNGEIVNAGDAVWYTVVLDKSYKNVEFSLCGSDLDTKLEVWRNCDDDDYIAYDDDAEPSCGSNASKIDLDYLFEGTYYVKVYAYNDYTGNYTLSINGEEAIPCNYTLNLYEFDNAIEGWTANTLNVYVNGFLALENVTIDGENTEFNIPVNTTNLITTTFADNDGNGYECYYTISDVLGNVVYTDGLDNIISGITEGIEADCNPDAEPITDLNALVLESNTEIELNWVLNEANNDVVIAYNDTDNFGTPEEGVTYIAGDMIGNSEVVFVGNAITFTMNNLEAGDHSFAVWSVNIANGYSDELKTTDIRIYAPGELCTDPLLYGNINDPVKFGNIPAGGEVWYTVDIDDQDYTEISFSLANSTFDTKIEVWNDCDAENYIAANDDEDYSNGIYTSLITLENLTAGTYFVKVFGYNSGSDGNYNLNITGRMTSTENDILDFTFGNVSVSTEIDNENYNINCFVLEGTDLVNLTPEMNISEYATVDTYTDFSSTVNYNVTAEDGSVQIWNVNVETLVGAPEVQVAVGEIGACVGEEVSVPVTMKFANNIGAITLYVEYDNTLLAYNGYDNLNAEISSALINDDNGVIGIAWYSPDNGADLYEETKLLDLNFIYLGGGNAILDIENQNNSIANIPSVTELTLELSNGEVNANPTANITTHPMDINVCNDTEAVFNVVADNVIFYQWQVNTGSYWDDISDSNPTSNSNQLVVNATNADNGNMYRCMLTSEECNIQTEEVTLTVMPTPEAEISLVEAGETCNGEEIAINVTFTDGTAPYSITYTDGTTENTINNINENPYTFNVQTAGEYELVSASDATCEANVSGIANVEYREIPTATLSGNFGICNGEEANVTINFTGNQPFSVTYMYASNTITISEIYTDAYSFIVDQVGTYQLLAVEDAYCTGVANGSAEIIAVSKPTATFGNDTDIIEGETASLEVNFTGYAPYDFVYTDGMGMEYTATSETNTFLLEIAPEETTTYTLLSVNDVNCSNNDLDDQATVNVTQLVKITGKVVYNNEYNVGLAGIDIKLNGFVNGSQVNFETETDNEGNYEFNVQNGTYTITASEDYIYETWGGVTATDALLAAQYGIGIVAETGALTDFQVEIGNVNDNMNLNSTDALMIIMRSVGFITEFPTGDWAFETKNIIAENSDIVVENLNAACYGDINASYYNAPGKKAERNISLINSGVLEVQSSTFEMPIKATENMELGAITLVIEYPNDIVEVKSVNSKLEGLRYNVIDNKIHVAWYNTNSANIEANEDLISLEFLRINEGNISLNISNESEFANADAKVLKNKVLTTPSIELSTVKALEFSISNYPNPFISETTIEYTLTEDAKVQLTVYDITGKEIVKLVNENQAKGVHTQEFDASELSNGMYLYEIKVKSENSEYRKINKMTVNK